MLGSLKVESVVVCCLGGEISPSKIFGRGWRSMFSKSCLVCARGVARSDQSLACSIEVVKGDGDIECFYKEVSRCYLADRKRQSTFPDPSF
jgi:hypothetical protein